MTAPSGLVIVARTEFKELLETPDAAEKVVPLVPKLIAPLRGGGALVSDECITFLSLSM